MSNAAFTPIKNPTHAQLEAIIRQSEVGCARRITDFSTGDQWVWDAAQATHAEGANYLGIDYALRPGEGDILVL